MVSDVFCFIGKREKSVRKALLENKKVIWASYEKQTIESENLRFFSYKSELEIPKVAHEIGRFAVLSNLVFDEKSPFQRYILHFQSHFKGRLNDMADFGCTLLKHLQNHESLPFYSVFDFRDALKGMPAVLVGSGPSLEKVKPHLSKWKGKAVFFSALSALDLLPFMPHFAVGLDPKMELQKNFELPFFYLSRMQKENLAKLSKIRIMAPEPHLGWVNDLLGFDEAFDVGWTVGNFMVSLASFLGCSPIITVGMEYRHERGRKYAFSEEVEEVDESWALAATWMKDFYHQSKEKEFYSLHSSLNCYFPQKKMEDFCFLSNPSIDEKVGALFHRRKMKKMKPFDLWEKKLKNSLDALRCGGKIEEEVLMMLNQLWDVWGGVFEMESHFLNENLGSLEVHKMLFFESVLKEHLSCFEY